MYSDVVAAWPRGGLNESYGDDEADTACRGTCRSSADKLFVFRTCIVLE